MVGNKTVLSSLNFSFFFPRKMRIIMLPTSERGFPHSSVGKESACNARDPGSIPESWRSPGEGSGNPLQYSCLENPMDREAWLATVHRVAKSRTHWATSLSLSLLHHFIFPWFCFGKFICLQSSRDPTIFSILLCASHLFAHLKQKDILSACI